MEQDTRIQICGLIAGVVSADQDIHVNEANFLQRVRARFQIPKGTPVPPVSDRDQAVEKLAAFDENTRQQTFDLLIAAAAADGKVDDAEREFLQSIAWMLKVDAEQLDERLDAQLATSQASPFTYAGDD